VSAGTATGSVLGDGSSRPVSSCYTTFLLYQTSNSHTVYKIITIIPFPKH